MTKILSGLLNFPLLHYFIFDTRMRSSSEKSPKTEMQENINFEHIVTTTKFCVYFNHTKVFWRFFLDVYLLYNGFLATADHITIQFLRTKIKDNSVQV